MPNSRRHSVSNSTPPMEHLNKEVNSLLDCSLSTNTWKTYKTAENCFNNFRALYGFPNSWPVPVDELAQFIAFLSFNKTSISTVKTYLSSISYAHKIRNLADPTKLFIINKMLEGLRRKNPHKSDVRAPISLELLIKLIESLRWICNSDYETRMFASAFSLAYFAMLRVSELSVENNGNEHGHALNFNDVTIIDKNGVTELHIKICSSKTDQKRLSATLILHNHVNSAICPINLLKSFICTRFSGLNGSNKLYIHFNGQALTKYQFCSVLQKSLRFCEVPFHIRSHSFRIGRATDLAKEGVDEDTIKVNGRWKSSSYLRYIRF